MFIERLNENEKKDFLELIYKIANCDNNFADEEEELINSYKNELGIEKIENTKTIDQLVEEFAEKSIQIKKVVFFELYGMIMADGKLELQEERIFFLIKNKFMLEEKSYTKLIKAAEQLQQAYDQVYAAIFD